MRSQPQFIEATPDKNQQSKFCINQQLKRLDFIKIRGRTSRLNFDDSLIMVNKQNTFGSIMPLLAKLSPRIYNQGKVQLNRRYSMPRVMVPRPQVQQHNIYQQFSQHLKIKKLKKIQNVGGIDTFWIFKKQKQAVETKDKKIDFTSDQLDLDAGKNPTESAFLAILTWAKAAPDINANITKGIFKGYLTSRFNENFAARFITFYNVKTFINFREFCQLGESIKNVGVRESNLISFMLYDSDGDGLICSNDVFQVFQSEVTRKIEDDLMRIADFVKNDQNYDMQALLTEFQMENLILSDVNLTVRDYRTYFKKIEEPLLKANVKKDTVFSKSFVVLDHREKVRSTRKQLQLKRSMFKEMMGDLHKFVEKQPKVKWDDFRLNFGLFNLIFPRKSKYFLNFVHMTFGLL